MSDKGKQEISVLGRLFSMEFLLLLMGLFSLGSGVVYHKPTQIFWGVTIGGGAVILFFVRKKDWKKHWEDQERMRVAYEEARKKERESDGKQ